MRTRLFQALATIAMGAAFAESSVSAQTVSVDLLRHPVSEKVRPLLLRRSTRRNRATTRRPSGSYGRRWRSTPSRLLTSTICWASNTLKPTAARPRYVPSNRRRRCCRTIQSRATTSAWRCCAPGDYDRATQEIQRAVELDPKNPRMQARLNELLEGAESDRTISSRSESSRRDRPRSRRASPWSTSASARAAFRRPKRCPSPDRWRCCRLPRGIPGGSAIPDKSGVNSRVKSYLPVSPVLSITGRRSEFRQPARNLR